MAQEPESTPFISTVVLLQDTPSESQAANHQQVVSVYIECLD